MAGLHNNVSSKQALRRLKVLQAIAEHLNRTADLPSMLDTALALVLELTDLHTGWIALVDETGCFYSAAAHGLPAGLAADDRAALRWSPCHCQRLLLAGEITEAVNIVQCERLERVRQALQAQGSEVEKREMSGLRCHASIPLRITDRVLGVMNLARVDDETIDDEELALLSLVGETLSAAIRRAQLQEQAKTARLQEQETLLRLSKTLLGLLEPEAIAQATFAAIHEHLHPDAISLLVPDAYGTHLELIAGEGWTKEHVSRMRLPLDPPQSSGVAWALHSRTPVFRDHTREEGDALTPEMVRRAGVQTSLIIPMLAEERAIGVLVLDSLVHRTFREDEVRFLSLIANQAASAVEKARLFAETAEALDRQRLINEIARTISGTLDLSTILQGVVRLAVEAVGAEAGALALVSPDGRHMTYPYLFNLPMVLSRRSVPKGQGLAWQIVESGESIRLADYSAHPLALREWVAAGVRAMIGVPVLAGDIQLGALGLFRFNPDKRFTARDVMLAEAIGRQAGVAIQNARLYEAERTQAQRQATLLRLSSDLAATLEEREICRTVVQGLHDTLGYDYLGLFLVDEATGDRVLCASVGWPDAPSDWRIPPGQGLSERPLLDGQLHYTPDVRRDPRYIPGLNSGAEVDVPLRAGEKVLGVLVVESKRPNAFNEQDFEVLMAAANQAAIAISNARLLAAERRRAQELDALRATAADITAELELSALLQTVVERAVGLLGASGGELGLYDPGRQELLIVASCNMGADYTGTRMVLGEGAMGRVAETCEPLIIDDYTTWEGRSPQYPRGPWHAVLAAPLMARGRLVGVIAIVDADPARRFTSSELHLLHLFAQQAAIAVENAHLFEAAQHRAQEAETLRRAGAAVTATLNLDEAIEGVLEQLEEVVPHDSASVQLLREGYLEIVGGRGWPDPSAVVGLRFPVPGDNPNTVVIQERRPYILGDAPAAYPPFREDPHSHIQSWLGVPLIVRDRVIGMLTVDSTEPHHFSSEHARLMGAFADQVAMVLENARLFEAEQRRREAAAALLDIAQVASSSLELKQVLRHITQRTARVCRATRCSIFLLDEAGEYLRPVMSQFADGHVDLELWQLFKTTAADRVDAVPLFRDAIRERHPTLLDDPTRTDLMPRKWTEPFDIQKLLIVPLISHDRVIGLMALDHTNPDLEFTPEQIELAQTVGGQVAASIENAQLYARTQQLAITDALTGLYNRRYFYQALGKELRRSQRYKRACSLLMLDLDDFKLYNDRHGHLAGDDLLRELAGLIRGVIREVDIVARYGGEEFTVILPETDATRARSVAERLWRAVREHEFVLRENRKAGRITVSVGVAAYPEHAQDVEGLIDAADMALLQAKEQKDRVCVAGH